MVENSVAGVTFDLRALIVAALNYSYESWETKRRPSLLQAFRFTDTLANMLFSGQDGPMVVPALLDLINGL